MKFHDPMLNFEHEHIQMDARTSPKYNGVIRKFAENSRHFYTV